MTVGPTLYLVRHGQTDWNCHRRYQGQRDVPLNATGRQQARRVVRALEGIGLEAVYASDLLRARQTAQPLARERGLDVILLPALREMDFGEWEGLTRAEVIERYPDEVRTWYRDWSSVQVPGGETVAGFVERVLTAFEAIVKRHPQGQVAVVSHGGPLRVYLCSVLGLEMSSLWEFGQETACINEVRYEATGPRLLRLNAVAHLRVATS